MKKRVGIILDSTSISKQLAVLMLLSKKSENYEITALLINNVERQKKIGLQIVSYINRRGLRKFLSNAVFRVVCKMESIFLKRMSKFNKFYNKIQLNKEDYVSISVRPQISKSGLIYRYAQEDINHIKELNLETLL
ncbi:hypothetical protein OAE14_00170 [Alphaproteobacteria bacterium]|nr:hypothetical protein [Alphaproteobacteria bacterium]